MVRLVTVAGLHSAYVDAAAALAIAIHIGLPVFMDGEFSPEDSQGNGQQHDVLGADAPAPGNSEPPREAANPIPQVFQEFIEGLKMTKGPEGSDTWSAKDDDSRESGKDGQGRKALPAYQGLPRSPAGRATRTLLPCLPTSPA